MKSWNMLMKNPKGEGDEMWLTSPVEGDGGGDDGDASQDGDDGQNHGVAAQTASSVHVALLQTVSGLNRVKPVSRCLSWDVI